MVLAEVRRNISNDFIYCDTVMKFGHQKMQSMQEPLPFHIWGITDWLLVYQLFQHAISCWWQCPLMNKCRALHCFWRVTSTITSTQDDNPCMSVEACPLIYKKLYIHNMLHTFQKKLFNIWYANIIPSAQNTCNYMYIDIHTWQLFVPVF